MFDHNFSECAMSVNTSLFGPSFHPSMTTPLVTFSLSSVGNLIAVFVIWRKQRKADKQSVFYTLVMTLALLDLISTWVTSPITFISYTTQTSVCNLGGDALCHYSGIVMVYFGVTTMAVVFTMSVERLIAVRFAFFYRVKVNVAKTRSIIIAILIFFLLFSLLPLIGLGEVNQQVPGTWCFLNWRSIHPQHQFYNFSIVTFGIVMLGGTIFCNIYVILQVIHKRKKMKICNSTLQVMSKRRLRKIAVDETQMMILLGSMTSIFTLCYLPLLVRISITQISTIYSFEDKTSSWNLFAVRMASINPVLDPWVYLLCRRKTIKKFFKFLKMVITCETFSKSNGKNGSEKELKRSDRFKSESENNKKLKITFHQRQIALKYGKMWREKSQSKTQENKVVFMEDSCLTA